MTMKRMMITAMATLLTVAGFAGQTATFTKDRLAKSADVKPGYWHPDLNKCKAYATKNKLPLIAVWSNGDLCGHCVSFESACSHSTFKNWRKNSGCVFFFISSADGSAGRQGGSAYNWVYGNKTAKKFPFVRVYWPAGKVDICTDGDALDGGLGGATGAKKTVAWLKAKLKKFTKTDSNLPYEIAFDANLPADYADFRVDSDVTTMDSVQTVYTNAVPAANKFELQNYAFTGWATATNGAVKYADNAALSKLTATSNATVTLYAKWAHSPVTINFNANFKSTDDGDVVEMNPLSATYNETVALSNAFVRKDFEFAGWAKTPDGSVVYKNNAAVKNLTTDASITLYAKWTRKTYRAYYTGKSYTISTGLKGYTAKTSFPGMKWTSSTGKWSGKPTKANATDPVADAGLKIKFVKGKTTVYRYFVVVKDALSLEGTESKTVEITTSDDDLEYAATAISGALKADTVTVTGLPAGMVFTASTGTITGRPTKAGTYTVTVKGTSSQGQTLSTTYTFVVAEGNQLVLNGMVHVDKMFMDAGEEKEIQVLFFDKDDHSYQIASVDVIGVEGLAYDAGKGAIVGMVAAGTYEMVITVKSADDDPAELTQKIKLVVLPPQQQE